MFVARVQYKPTVEQLGEELTSITAPADVARALERTVRRWLDCDSVDVLLVQVESSGEGAEPVSAAAASHGGRLSLPVEFGGVRLGILTVGPKRGGALFTEDDLDLLKTITNQGALALAHARAYQELEHRRREQAAAWREERSALVETVAAELAHEIRYPINFFRNLFGGKARQNRIDAEDVEIGLEEVERLERLVSGLRRMATRRLERTPTSLTVVCDKTETLLRDALGMRRIRRRIPEGVHILCDPDQMTQILVNLLANALHAAGVDGSVGIEWSDAVGATHVQLTIWDTGSGFEGDGAKLFAPWFTTKPGGTGLGLAITHRLVRAHGWNIRAARNEARTEFVIEILAADVVGARAGESRAQEVA